VIAYDTVRLNHVNGFLLPWDALWEPCDISWRPLISCSGLQTELCLITSLTVWSHTGCYYTTTVKSIKSMWGWYVRYRNANSTQLSRLAQRRSLLSYPSRRLRCANSDADHEDRIKSLHLGVGQIRCQDLVSSLSQSKLRIPMCTVFGLFGDSTWSPMSCMFRKSLALLVSYTVFDDWKNMKITLVSCLISWFLSSWWVALNTFHRVEAVKGVGWGC